ncbi:hypothetical protein KS4_31150 [Poriferisphaera corsica]|uniref:2-oxoadipate dioxygenase/decarboxylase n=1 Tax=Poriferisphaera corsica TaxID=2528020 RepID=A0A517YXT5_9BACT|nr:DUF1338 domain-containing protein [Poriferisphaera corsica]QDU35038.1 hypothetical protein KS4_31150 [Poriferisphaera corsica]
MRDAHELLAKLWENYSNLIPQAKEIHGLLEARGDKVANDHIALRTYNDPRIGVESLAKYFERFGYKACGEYEFKAKKLRAKHFEHEDPDLPLVFISELKTEEFSDELQSAVKGFVDQIKDEDYARDDFPCIGRPWDVSHETYLKLADESEYAGWMAAFGFRANHFTVYINALSSMKSLEEMNQFLKDNGYPLNTSGGEIKGTPEMLLEQSSTLADKVEIPFTDGKFVIPSCYYEFARRYPKPNGEIFTGFVAQSADKIFESTDRQKA